VLVGFAAALFSTCNALELATVHETQQFLAAYCNARGREFSDDETERSWQRASGLGPTTPSASTHCGSPSPRSRRRTPASASEVASGIALPASHVSAQLTRLSADGLVRRTGVRGQFTVAPLLSGWIGRRAARDESSVTRPSPGRTANQLGSRRGKSAAYDGSPPRSALTSRNTPHKPRSERLVPARPRRGAK